MNWVDMGSLLPALDILLNNLLRPTMQSYQFRQYESAAKGLYNLNMFLNGYGIGQVLQEPQSIPMDIHQRATPWADYRTYYDRNFPTVIKSVGIYIRDVLKSMKNQHFIPEPSPNDQTNDMELPPNITITDPPGISTVE